MNGIVIINKQKGYTSHDIVAKVKKILNVKKVGHTGTLDPNATGVLPILIGQGTKLSSFLINHDKTYIATIKLGEKTDTADAEGNIVEKKQVDKNLLNEENVKEILNSFIGKQEQVPPMYSAIKVNGKKLYEYARKGESVEIKPRKIEIYNIELISIENLEISFKVECSKGTYIRTLCEDIAEKINTVGYMEELERTKVGNFEIANALTLEEFEKQKKVITIEEFFENKEKIVLNKKQLRLFLNGVNLKYNLDNNIYLIYDENNNFIGIGIIKNNLLKREIII